MEGYGPAKRDGDNSRMKASVFRQFGPPDVLSYEDVPDPQPRSGEIRIRIHAASINRVLDVSLRAGKENFRGPVLPLIPGVDCAGLVEAVGAGVTRWKAGGRVAAEGEMPLETWRQVWLGRPGPAGVRGSEGPGGFADLDGIR